MLAAAFRGSIVQRRLCYRIRASCGKYGHGDLVYRRVKCRRLFNSEAVVTQEVRPTVRNSELQLRCERYKTAVITNKSDLLHFYEAITSYASNENEEKVVAFHLQAPDEPKAKASLLQFAFNYSIFIMDMVELRKKLIADDWSTFVKTVFQNGELRKLCLHFEKQFPILKNGVPIDILDSESFENIVCLKSHLLEIFKDKTFYRQVVESCQLNNVEAPVQSIKDWNLELICRVFLHSSLQRPLYLWENHWSRRPLTEYAISAAATNVFCLLEIYPQLYRLSKATECFEAVDRMKSPYKSLTKPNDCRDFALTVDNGLRAAAKNLRRCGIDCKNLYIHDHPSLCVKHAIEENRLVITSETFGKTMARSVDVVYFDARNLSKYEQMLWILDYLNIVVRPKDAFTRCEGCNDVFSELPFNQVRELWMRKKGKYVPWRRPSQQQRLLPQSTELEAYKPEHNIINMRKMTIRETGEPLLFLDLIPIEAFETVKQFLVCEPCGRVRWFDDNKRTPEAYYSLFCQVVQKKLQAKNSPYLDIFYKRLSSKEE